MNASRFLKQILTILMIGIILVFTNVGYANAVLQSNKNTHYVKKDSTINWMTNFRNMEKSGHAMGLNETLRANLTAASESNNLDVHMMRATEYGAVAILSASGYGNPSNENAITTTTGNNTGVMINTDASNSEFVAGGAKGQIFTGVDVRYYDEYIEGDLMSSRVGDALGNATTTNPGCIGWHSGEIQYWPDSRFPYIGRGATGIFAYNGYTTNYNFFSRGVVVCGVGL